VRVEKVSGGAARGAGQLGAGGGRPWRSSWGREEAWYYYFLILVMMPLDLGGFKVYLRSMQVYLARIGGVCRVPPTPIDGERDAWERYAFNKGRAAKQ
jgi:hypothetical protein